MRKQREQEFAVFCEKGKEKAERGGGRTAANVLVCEKKKENLVTEL